MVLPAGATDGPVFMTAKSAEVLTVVVAVDVLLVELESALALLIVAALLICVPLATLALIVTVMVKVSTAPFGKVAMVSLTLLPLLKRVKTSWTLAWLCDTNVSVAGSTSDSVTFWASLGPLFVTVIV